MVECDSPEGYTISYPADWETNSGDVVPQCGQFHPEPFEVTEGTDERVAAVNAYVDPVPYSEVAADAGDVPERAVTAIDGLQAIRVEREAGPDGLWPERTPLTFYSVDVSTSEEDRTLFVDTVGLEQFDYETNQTVLDTMARSLDIEMDGVDDSSSAVAQYRGGGGGFSVEARVDDGGACLWIPTDGDEICTDVPASDQLHTIQLENLDPVLAGVTGADVFSVTADLVDGGTITVLPVPIEGTEAGGFSFTVGLGDIERFTLVDSAGNEINVVQPGG